MWNFCPFVFIIAQLFLPVYTDFTSHSYRNGESVLINYRSEPGFARPHMYVLFNCDGTRIAKFKMNSNVTGYCNITLVDNNRLIQAVNEAYWYESFEIDGLPAYSMVGHTQPDKSFTVWGHKRIEVKYNGDRIVGINVDKQSKRRLQVGRMVELTYQIIWKKCDTKFSDRMDRYAFASSGFCVTNHNAFYLISFMFIHVVLFVY